MTTRGVAGGTMIDRAVSRMRDTAWLRRPVLSIRTVRARLVEKRMNIDTITLRSGVEGARGLFRDGNWYEAVDYPLLYRYLSPLNLAPVDTVFDIGCGMGRILCVCAQKDVKRCVGIEINAPLAERALENASRMHGRRAAIDVFTQDATESDYSEGTVFILFNPFGAETMQKVLERIRSTLEGNPRTIRLAYWNPHHEKVFEKSGWLTSTGRLKSVWYRNTASYWTNKEPAS